MDTVLVWVIMRIVPGFSLLAKDGVKFTNDHSEAWYFDTEAEAQAVAATIKTPLQVQQLKVNAPMASGQPAINFPGPDFFESISAYMSVEELIEQIIDVNLKLHFTPVKHITGGGQMTGNGIGDTFSSNLVGREIQFSFSELLADNAIQRLNEIIRISNKWTTWSYQIHRHGCTAYAVLTLRSKNK